jgi:imidazolonepropionase-like amidohydrolase
MQGRRRLQVALAVAAGIACAHSNVQIPEHALVVQNGTVIDGTGRPPIVNGLVAVEGRRILAVGEAAAFDVPEGVTVVDAGGGTILPGIVDSHTHSNHDASVRRTFLVDGVTTVCNLGTSLDRLSLFEDDSTAEGPAARGYWAGPIITAPGGYPGPVYGQQFSYEVGSVDEARAAVADLLDRGASMIKIALAPGDPQTPWPVLDLARVQAIVEEAHARGVLIRAHVFEPYLVEDIVLPAGVDVIEHQPFPILSQEEETRVLASDHPGPLLFDSIAPDYERLLTRVVDGGVVMVPTLQGNIGEIFALPERSRIEQIVLDVHLEAARRFRSLGGTFALGTDFGGVPHVQAGMPLTEMRLLHAAGLTSMEVLEASTLHAATVCGQGSNLGSLEVGKLADIIIVHGDPLADLAAMDSVIAVVKDGTLAFQAH